MKKIKVKLKKLNQPLCSCGCGQPVAKRGNKYILGHNQKSTDNAVDHRWKPGQSGNPSGCKTGSRHKVSLAVENLLMDDCERITSKAISMALSGNAAIMTAILDRLVPKKKSALITVEGLPRVDKIESMDQLTGFILNAISTGKLSPMDGEILSRVVDKHGKSLEINQLVKRIEELEEKLSA